MELMTILDEHDIDKTCMDSKIKMTQTKQIAPIKNINKTQIKQKQNSILHGILKQCKTRSSRTN